MVVIFCVFNMHFQSFAPLPMESIEKILDIDRAGLVFLREGATTVCQNHYKYMKREEIIIIFNTR